MSDTIKNSGSCLCGAVQVEVAEMKKATGACHCGMCRKWVGGPYISADCGTDVTFTGEENITVYNSSAWAERGFCKICGSSLFYRLNATQHYHMPVGIFADLSELSLTSQIYIDKKPAFYSFAEQTTVMTEAEVLEKWG